MLLAASTVELGVVEAKATLGFALAEPAFVIVTTRSSEPAELLGAAEDVAVNVVVDIDVCVTVVAVFVAYRPNPAAAITIKTIVTAANTVVDTPTVLPGLFIPGPARSKEVDSIYWAGTILKSENAALLRRPPGRGPWAPNQGA